MKDLEPKLTRQRLIIEAKYEKQIDAIIIEKFLKELSYRLKMTIDRDILVETVNKDIQVGFYAFAHWVESGCQMYVWTELKFLTIDIYTCKKFSVEDAIGFTKEFFDIEELVYKEV